MRLPPTLASIGQTGNSQATVRAMSVCFFTVRCVWVRKNIPLPHPRDCKR